MLFSPLSTSRWRCCLRDPCPAAPDSICPLQESLQRAMFTFAYYPFRGIRIKFMMCVGCSLHGTHEQKRARTRVKRWNATQRVLLRERVCAFGRGPKGKTAASVFVCVCSGAPCLGEPPAVWGNGASHCGSEGWGWWLLCLLLQLQWGDRAERSNVTPECLGV